MTTSIHSRVLDIDRAVSTVKYTVGGITYRRETFASFPDDVIVMRLTSSARGKINFTARFSYPQQMQGHGASISTLGQNVLVMHGRAPSNTDWDDRKGMRLKGRPTTWMSGNVSGLRARGDFSIAITWNRGRLKHASLTSQAGKPARIRAASRLSVICNGKPVTVRYPEPGVVEFPTTLGAVYDLDPTLK